MTFPVYFVMSLCEHTENETSLMSLACCLQTVSLLVRKITENANKWKKSNTYTNNLLASDYVTSYKTVKSYPI